MGYYDVSDACSSDSQGDQLFEHLCQEHSEILNLLDALDGAKDFQALAAAVDLVARHARGHHGDEERHLFPRLTRLGLSHARARLEKDHYVLENLARRVSSGAARRQAQAFEWAHELSEVTRRHMRYEGKLFDHVLLIERGRL